MSARFLYRCRRCQEVHGSVHTAASNGLTYLIRVTSGESIPILPLLAVHSCQDGGGGVSDLVGYEEVD